MFRFDIEYGLNVSETTAASDHYPIYAEFWCDRDADPKPDARSCRRWDRTPDRSRQPRIRSGAGHQQRWQGNLAGRADDPAGEGVYDRTDHRPVASLPSPIRCLNQALVLWLTARMVATHRAAETFIIVPNPNIPKPGRLWSIGELWVRPSCPGR